MEALIGMVLILQVIIIAGFAFVWHKVRTSTRLPDKAAPKSTGVQYIDAKHESDIAAKLDVDG